MSDHADQTTAVRPGEPGEVTASQEAFEELDEMEFLDDIDFTLDEVENKIAPLALAHH